MRHRTATPRPVKEHLTLCGAFKTLGAKRSGWAPRSAVGGAARVRTVRAPAAVAVVLTFRRPVLAARAVQALLDKEAFRAEDVIVVVNGEGGLADESLAARVTIERLPENTGPAGGFRRGLELAAQRSDRRWIYLCEDDVGLFELPSPRVADLIERVEALERTGGRPAGAVVAYGRALDLRSGEGSPHRPSAPDGFEEVDVAAWGATLVSRRVVERDVLPDSRWFFAYEDWDFFLRVRRAGFRVLLDNRTATAVATKVTGAGRHRSFAGARPAEQHEPWRAYYQARNFFELARRHGRRRWLGSHLVKSARRFQLAGGAATRLAIAHGLVDGARGRLGKVTRYERSVGEAPTPSDQSDGSSSGNSPNSTSASDR